MDEAGNDVIQVNCIKCVGVSIGTPDFVQKFNTDKASKILADVEKGSWYLNLSSASTSSASAKIFG